MPEPRSVGTQAVTIGTYCVPSGVSYVDIFGTIWWAIYVCKEEDKGLRTAARREEKKNGG